jgi:hypothetical protein
MSNRILRSLVLLLLIHFASGAIAFSDAAKRKAFPNRPAKTEITSIELQDYWQPVTKEVLPKSAYLEIRSFLSREKWAVEAGAVESCTFVLLDINFDGENEIVVANPAFSGSGGLHFFILKSSGAKWKVIGEFQGGLIFTGRNELRENDDYYQIISYYRSGDTFQRVFDFRKGYYFLSSEAIIPRAITESNWWQGFWRSLNSN